MRDIIAITQLTLDGVMQAPGGPEEDPSNQFTHGGWATPFLDDRATQDIVSETIAGGLDMLLGRRTYDVFAAYWPSQGRGGVDPVWWTVFLRCFLHGMHQLEFERAAVVERRVATLGIVEAVNVLAN